MPGDRSSRPASSSTWSGPPTARRPRPSPRASPPFFKDDGVLLKKFVFRVAPQRGSQEGRSRWCSASSRLRARRWSSSSSRTWCCPSWPLPGAPPRDPRAVLPGPGRPRDRRAGPGRARPRGRRQAPQARGRRLGIHRPHPRRGREGRVGDTFTFQAPQARSHRDRARHRGPRPGSTLRFLPHGPRRPAARPRAVQRRRVEGREDLRPEPRLHGEELRRQRRPSASSPCPVVERRRVARPGFPAGEGPPPVQRGPASEAHRAAGAPRRATARAAERKELAPGGRRSHRPLRVPREGRGARAGARTCASSSTTTGSPPSSA